MRSQWLRIAEICVAGHWRPIVVTVCDLTSGKVAEITVVVAVAGYLVEHHVADLLVTNVSSGEENSARLIWIGPMRVI